MPYYRIIVTEVSARVTTGVRFDYLDNIDQYKRKIEQKCITRLGRKYGRVDVYMLASDSPEIREYQEKKAAVERRKALATTKTTEQIRAEIIRDWHKHDGKLADKLRLKEIYNITDEEIDGKSAA